MCRMAVCGSQELHTLMWVVQGPFGRSCCHMVMQADSVAVEAHSTVIWVAMLQLKAC